jgi:hypothetical protein
MPALLLETTTSTDTLVAAKATVGTVTSKKTRVKRAKKQAKAEAQKYTGRYVFAYVFTRSIIRCIFSLGNFASRNGGNKTLKVHRANSITIGENARARRRR